MRRALVLTFLTLTLCAVNQSLAGDWELYDDFNSAGLNSNRWKINNDISANVNLKNGSLCLELLQNTAKGGALLQAKQKLKNVAAIKSTASFANFDGDIKGFMWADAGQIESDLVVMQVMGMPQYEKRRATLERRDSSKNWSLLAKAEKVAPLPDIPFTLEMNVKSAAYGVGDDFQGTIAAPFSIEPAEQSNWGLGIKTYAPNARGSVCFDEVWIMYEQ